MKRRNIAKRKKEIMMLPLPPADDPPQDVEQSEDQIPLNITECNVDSPKFFSAPCSPLHSLSIKEFGTEAVVIDSFQNLNIAGLHEGTGEESNSVACDRDSATNSVSSPNLKDLMVEVTSNREEEIPAEKSVVPDQHITIVAEERKQVVEIFEDPLEQEDSIDDRASRQPFPENCDSFGVRRLSGGAETMPAQVEPCAPPQMVQRTKWWSCCGLLEAFHRP